MKKLLQQTTCIILSLLLFAGAIIVHPAMAKASEKDTYTTLYSSPATETAIANEPKSFSFTTKSKGPLTIMLTFMQPTTFSYKITAPNGSEMASESIFDTDSGWRTISNNNMTLYVNGASYSNVTVGTFTLDITTNVDTSYVLDILQEPEPASLSNSTMTITEGFTDTLKVINNTGKVTWKSSNTKIATVNSKGVVSAKKKGTCTITATTASNQQLTCKIKVRNNVYTTTKGTNADAVANEVTVYAYKGSFDSKGNLVCNYRVINNRYNTVTELVKFKINVINDKNKKVFSYNVGSKSIRVPGNIYKDFKVTIPKSSVKKCDLAKCVIKSDVLYRFLR